MKIETQTIEKLKKGIEIIEEAYTAAEEQYTTADIITIALENLYHALARAMLEDFESAFIEIDDQEEFIDYLLETHEHDQIIENLISQEQGNCTWVEDQYVNFNPDYKEKE